MRVPGRPAPARAAGLLVAGLMALVLVGCARETDSSRLDPSHEGEGDSASRVLDARVVEILSATAAGGSADPQRVVRLDEPGGLSRLVRELTRPQLVADLRRVLGRTRVPAGQALAGAVVAVGCDVPSDLMVLSDGEPRIKPLWTGVERLQECLAPVTSIGVVLIDEELVSPAG